MTKASDNVFPRFLISEGGSTSTPAANRVTLYAKADGLLYSKDDAGAETLVSGGAGGGSVATDALWDAAGDLAVGSGANTAAKLTMGAAGGHVSRVNGAVAWNSGTSFPTAATGDRYWRTDLGMEAYYDGTRWLTTQLFTDNGHVGIDGSMSTGGYTVDAVAAVFTPWAATYDLYITTWQATLRVNTANSGNTGSHYWTCKVQRGTSANSYSDLTGATFNTSAGTADVTAVYTATVGQLWTPGTYPIGRVLLAKTGTPGVLVYAPFRICYRLVLT